jgi:hypothetical protein
LFATCGSGSTAVFEGTGKLGLYYIDLTNPAPSATAALSDSLPASQSLRELWHNRLGHVNYRIVDKMPQYADGISFRKPTAADYIAGDTACEACLAGRQKESFNKSTDNRATTKLRRLHCDISGIQVESVRGYRYFLLVEDDACRCVWIRFMKGKTATDCVPEFKQLVHELELEHDAKVVYVRADNGTGEFGAEFQDFLKSKYIKFEPSPAWKHSLNGVIERMMQTIKKIARSMLYRASASERLWCYAVEHAVHIQNRVISAALPWGEYTTVIPYEAYTGQRPNFKNLKVWGCAAYPVDSLEKKPPNWQPRTRQEHLFVGMRGNKIWKFLNLETLKEEVSADVDFHEYKFPKIAEDANGKLLPREPRKPSLKALPNNPKLLERTADASRTELSRNPPARSVSAEREPQPPDKRVCREQNTGSKAPARSDSADTPARSDAAERRGEALEPMLSRGVLPTPGGSGNNPDLPGSVTAPPAAGSRVRGPNPAAIFKPTRSGRIPKKTVFTDSVAQLVVALHAVHIEGETSSIEVPAAPFEAITLEEAMREDAPNWKTAMLRELQSLKDSNTFSIVPIPSNRKVIHNRWVLRNKLDALGALARRKARLVIKGFEQQHGVDYFSTFASVARFNTLRAVLCKTATEDLEADHVDVETAFLNTPLKEEVYMYIPEFFHLLYPDMNFDGLSLRLLRSLYGLKQAPRSWFQEVNSFFSSIGFKPAEADPNLFVRRGVHILLYVDDMLVIGKRDAVDAAKLQIASKWKCKELGSATSFCGFQITRDRSAMTLTIHQTAYVSKLLDRFKLDKSNPTQLPLPAGTVLKLDDDTRDHTTGEYQPLVPPEVTVYRQAVGSLIWLSNGTRPDISYAVGQLARHMQDPRICHLRLAKQVMRYLNGTRNLGITYQPTALKANLYDLYSDSTWGSESDRVSFQGWAVIRSGGAISWVSNRQKSTAQSSMEAEFMAASEASREAAWLEKLNRDLSDQNKGPPTLRLDNVSAVTLIHDPKFHARAKHIDIRYMFIRNDMVGQDRLKVEHIPGADQPADILTKQLPVEAMQKHIKTLGMRRA